MARVSDDHADPSLCVADMASPKKSGGRQRAAPRLISQEEVKQHSGKDGGSFWAVVDSFVVDATAFVDSHPGGLKKLLSLNPGFPGCAPT